MKTMAIGVWIRGHIKESMIYLVMGVLAMYILFVMQLQLWMKLVVVVLLLFGAYEAVNKMHGKKSVMNDLQKGIQEAQKGMAMPDLSDSMGKGFGPFQGKR